jgi:hypothetical protein
LIENRKAESARYQQFQIKATSFRELGRLLHRNAASSIENILQVEAMPD